MGVKGQIPWNKGKKGLQRAWNKGIKTGKYEYDEKLRSKKISESLKGRKLSDTHKQKLRECRIGKKLSEETKKKIGINNPNWGGKHSSENKKIRQSIEYKLWRDAVFARDGYTCQKCLKLCSGNLNAHHILNFTSHKELSFAIDNGITLCKKCHTKFHKKYGFNNNNIKQLLLYLAIAESIEEK